MPGEVKKKPSVWVNWPQPTVGPLTRWLFYSTSTFCWSDSNTINYVLSIDLISVLRNWSVGTVFIFMLECWSRMCAPVNLAAQLELAPPPKWLWQNEVEDNKWMDGYMKQLQVILQRNISRSSPCCLISLLSSVLRPCSHHVWLTLLAMILI